MAGRQIGTMIKRILTSLLALAGALLLSAGTAIAGQGSIVFIKSHDVWLANADGTGQYRVTRSGTAAQPWRSPSQANDGTIAASHLTRIVRMRQNGQVINSIDPPPLMNSVSHPVDGVPVKVAISPDGRRIAWSFVSYECPIGASCGARTATGYTDADHVTAPKRYGSTYFYDPSWAGNARTLQSGGYGYQVNIHDLGTGDPVHWFDDGDYAENDTDLGDAELAPDGSRLAAVRGYGPGTHIIWYRVSGNALSGPPPAVPAPECATGQLEGLSGPSFSPDGKALVWEEPDGLWLKTNLGVCEDPQPRLIVPGGSEPDWGPAPVAPGPRDAGPITVRRVSTRLKAALRKGIVFRVKANGPGKLRLTVTKGKQRVAAGSSRARTAGWTKVTARFTKSAKRRLARTRRAKLMARFQADGRSKTLRFVLK